MEVKKYYKKVIYTGRLPSNYTELEYIQSSGTQYIDTGYLPILNTRFIVDAEFLDISTGRFGAYGNNETGLRFYFGAVSNKWAMGYGASNGGFNHSIRDADTNRHTFEINNSNFLIDNSSIYSYTRVWTSTSGNIFLFQTINNFTTTKVYSCKIMNGTTLVRNFIPAKRNSDDVVGMYDLVSNTFYTNSGTGTFIAGGVVNTLRTYYKRALPMSALPNGYTELEYIESSGTQWIDTGITVNSLTLPHIRTKFQVTAEEDRDHFGVDGSGGTILWNVLYRSSQQTYPALWVRWGTTGGTTLTYETGKDARSFNCYNAPKTLEVNTVGTTGNYYIDGVKIATSTVSPGFGCTGSICISKGRTCSQDKWYLFEIYDGETLLFNGIPAKRISDNVLGMYDLAWNGANYGSYTFTGNETSQVLLDNWRSTDTTYGIGFRYSLLGDGVNYPNMNGLGPAYCNSGDLPLNTYSNLYNGSVSPAFCYYTGNDNLYSLFVRLPKTIANSKSDVLNWLKGKTIYYQRTTDPSWSTPFYTNSGTGTFTAGPEIINSKNYYKLALPLEDPPQYLCFTANSAVSTVTLTETGTPSWTGEYSLDGSTWSEYVPGTTGAITLPEIGSKVYFRGTLSADNTIANYLSFTMTGNIKASGNINSLCYKDTFGELTALTYAYSYYYLFKNCTVLTDITELTLPATTLTTSCYGYMFNGCSGITTAPTLPSTTLANSCYYYMFKGCTALTTAPALPAMALQSTAYCGMFFGCTSLTSAPELPATVLNSSCYSQMFAGCSSLANAPALPATTLVSNCYNSMFEGCSSITSAPALPATTLLSNCYKSMFKDCSSLTTAPTLSATRLISGCYQSMFEGCTSLTDTPDLQHVISTEAQSLYLFCPTSLKSHLGTALSTLNAATFTPSGTSISATVRVAYHFTDSDIPASSVTTNCIKAGTNKATYTWYIYTDNTAIKNACTAKADNYTIVNMYHLDGTPW